MGPPGKAYLSSGVDTRVPGLLSPVFSAVKWGCSCLLPELLEDSEGRAALDAAQHTVGAQQMHVTTWRPTVMLGPLRPGWIKQLFTNIISFTLKLVLKAQVGETRPVLSPGTRFPPLPAPHHPTHSQCIRSDTARKRYSLPLLWPLCLPDKQLELSTPGLQGNQRHLQHHG